ncbi:MAG: zinc-ribbon domain-containing protein [Candidatus Omnitrophica bacterium]|nr:zinc-ribbon domain-containing protein [Candidatus Omnitrophota bacterium]
MRGKVPGTSCLKCQASVGDGDKFCSSCGTKLE